MRTVQEIKRHLRNGDMAKVAQLAGVTRKYAIKLMERPTAAKHADVIKAAKKVAKSNLKLGV